MRRHISCPPVQLVLAFLLIFLLQNVSSVRISPFRQPLTAPMPVNMRSAARQANQNNVPRVPPQFNINSGGPAIGRFIAEDPSWIVGDTSDFNFPGAVIGGAEDKNLPMYKSHRFGTRSTTWGYDIPVMEPGTYGCTIHFAETASEKFTAGQRVFDLYMATSEGEPVVFENIDIVGELGGAEFTVLTKTAPSLIITGILSIRANPSIGEAIISGITCERIDDLPPGIEPDFDTDPSLPTEAVVETSATPQTSVSESGVTLVGTEININCGGPALGRFIAEDYNWIRGETSMWEGPPGAVIGGAEEKNAPAVVAHRYGVNGGRWGYVIPLQRPGIYDCSLHFAETDSSSFKVGARVFDILVQDKVLEDVDVFRDAGPAPFTSVVKTFTELKVGGDLMMAFRPKNGDAFLSAITCEKVGDLDESEIEKPSETPDLLVSPESETATPTTPEIGIMGPDQSSSPDTTEPSVEAVDASPTPIVAPGAGAASSLEPSAEPMPSEGDLDDIESTITATVDPELTAGEGQVLRDYTLLAVVSTSDQAFTETIKEGIKSASASSTELESQWAITKINMETETVTTRQAEGTTYRVNAQGLYNTDDESKAVEEFDEFVRSGNMDAALEANGIDDVRVRLRGPENLDLNGTDVNSNETAPTSGGPGPSVVGIVMGCILGVLLLVAVIAFFVVRNRNNRDPSAEEFDAPPPAMSESERSSGIERSETGASVEYLDDDSTFTAATSRAGDNVDQVAFVKDVFGRGTADGAHGTA